MHAARASIAASYVVFVAAVLVAFASEIGAATPREQVEARRKTNPQVIVDVITGEQFTGTIERTMEDEFYLVDKTGIDRILVPYFAVRALIDPATGERMTLDQPPPQAPKPERAPEPASPPAESARSPLVFWVVGGAVGGALGMWLLAARAKRS